MPRYAILEAPSALGHIPEHLGVERAPGVLLAAGLADGLAARWAGRVMPGGYSAARDPATKVMNPQALNRYSTLLADAVAAVLQRGVPHCSGRRLLDLARCDARAKPARTLWAAVHRWRR